MKKIFFILLFILFFFVIFTVNAQMMGIPTNINSEETIQDEAVGKSIWDKLQNKQIACKDLKDDDFDVLGDFFMGNMMGTNHTYMNRLMTQRLGENGEKQMHISMGKRLSGCDTNANLPQGANYFIPMMTGLGGMMFGNWNQPWGDLINNRWDILGGITWFLIVTFLVLGIIYFLVGIKKNKTKAR